MSSSKKPSFDSLCTFFFFSCKATRCAEIWPKWRYGERFDTPSSVGSFLLEAYAESFLVRKRSRVAAAAFSPGNNQSISGTERSIFRDISASSQFVFFTFLGQGKGCFCASGKSFKNSGRARWIFGRKV